MKIRIRVRRAEKAVAAVAGTTTTAARSTGTSQISSAFSEEF